MWLSDQLDAARKKRKKSSRTLGDSPEVRRELFDRVVIKIYLPGYYVEPISRRDAVQGLYRKLGDGIYARLIPNGGSSQIQR